MKDGELGVAFQAFPWISESGDYGKRSVVREKATSPTQVFILEMVWAWVFLLSFFLINITAGQLLIPFKEWKILDGL